MHDLIKKAEVLGENCHKYKYQGGSQSTVILIFLVATFENTMSVVGCVLAVDQTDIQINLDWVE